jgi:hypothetical protein
MNTANRILQIAYCQGSNFHGVEIDKRKMDIPEEVRTHFRDIRNIQKLVSPVMINIFDEVISDRKRYLAEAKKFISSYRKERCVVFLDPDTGLEPEKSEPNLGHVLAKEAKEFWDTLKPFDTLALYQHQTNRSGKPWEETKRVQFEEAIGIPQGSVKIGRGLQLAKDVVLFYVQKV